MYCRGISLNKNNDVFISGVFEDSIQIGSSIFTKQGAVNTVNIFVTKFDDNGSFKWISQTYNYTDVYSSPGAFEMINDENKCYVTGTFSGKTGFGNSIVESDCWQDAFIAKIKDNDNLVGRNKFDSKEESTLSIFPNPTQGIFTINYTTPEKTILQINISDSKGQRVFAETIYDFTGTYKKAVDLSKHAKGVYFIELTGNAKKEVKRVVVE